MALSAGKTHKGERKKNVERGNSSVRCNTQEKDLDFLNPRHDFKYQVSSSLAKKQTLSKGEIPKDSDL